MANITGTSGNDTLAGTISDDTITGGAGGDSVTGDAGNDLLLGDDGTSPSANGEEGAVGPGSTGGGYGRVSGATVNNGDHDFSTDAFYLGNDIPVLNGGDSNAIDGQTFSIDGVGTDRTFASQEVSFTGGARSFIGAVTVERTSAGGDQISADGTNFLDIVSVNSGDIRVTMNDGQVFPSIEVTFAQDADGNTYMFPSDGQHPGAFNAFRNLLATNSSGIASFEINNISDTQNGIFVIDGDWADNQVGPLEDGTGGDDTLVGGGGADTIHGEGGNDSIDGGADADSITGGGGSDTIDGGTGNDTIDAGYGSDTILLGDGYDGDLITGGEGENAADTVGTDIDVLDASGVTTGGVDIVLTSPEAGSITSGEGAATFVEIESFVLTDQADSFDGFSSGSDMAVDAGGGNDTITGGGANNTLIGGAGDDLFNVGIGTDSIEGGIGTDTLSIALLDDVIDLEFDGDGQGFFTDHDGDGGTFIEIEAIEGSSGDDTINAAVDTQGVSLSGMAGDDSITGGSGSDSISGGADNDRITGGGGDDTIEGDSGDDRLSGNAGDDSILGGIGNDTLEGESGADYIEGGDGNDVLIGYNAVDAFGGVFTVQSDDGSDDTLIGGAGGDLIYGGDGNDRLEAGLGSDTLFGGDGDDLLIRDGTDVDNTLNELNGGAGDDTIRLEGGLNVNDQIDGGDNVDLLEILPDDNRDLTIDMVAGDVTDGATGQQQFTNIENITSGGGDDTIIGNGVENVLTGGAGDDTIAGGGGNDTLVGGTGRDTLEGGAGADTLTGGSGADVFVVDDQGDLITDFDATTGIGDADNTNNDFVDLSGFYNTTSLANWNTLNPGQTYSNALGWMRADLADGLLAEAGNLRIEDGFGSLAPNSLNFENTGVVCFTPGTRIRVPGGEVPIEMLRPGDLVVTRDNGVKPILWIGSKQLGQADLAAAPNLRPVCLAAGHFGLKRDLIVSPQHGVLLRDCRRGGSETLYRARHLSEIQGGAARIMNGCRGVTYIHFLLDQHEVVFSDGIASESLYPGPIALSSLDAEAQAELATLFPDLEHGDIVETYGAPAREYSRRTGLPDHLRVLVETPGKVTSAELYPACSS